MSNWFDASVKFLTGDADVGDVIKLGKKAYDVYKGSKAGSGPFEDKKSIPISIVLPAFITSELKTAFEIGFLIFLPFLVIDLVIASILMSLGMMMLSPMLISLPFKLLLFVLVDGWAMTIGSLSATFLVS